MVGYRLHKVSVEIAKITIYMTARANTRHRREISVRSQTNIHLCVCIYIIYVHTHTHTHTHTSVVKSTFQGDPVRGVRVHVCTSLPPTHMGPE